MIVTVDGIEIDTSTWIDDQLIGFKTKDESIVTRCKRLAEEIARQQQVLETYENDPAHGTFIKAQFKAYLQALKRLEIELAEEWNEIAKDQ